MPTKTPAERVPVVRPPASRSLRIPIAAVVVLLAVALTAGATVLRGGGEKINDVPGQPQAALTGSYTVQDPAFGRSYTLALPEPPLMGAAASSPTSFGSMGAAKVSAGTSFLFVRMQPGVTDARGAVAAVEDGEFLQAVSDIRRTRVGGLPAFARDFSVGGNDDRRLREFRFEHAGNVYGIGLLYRPSDDTGLNTALAALQTLRWAS